MPFQLVLLYGLGAAIQKPQCSFSIPQTATLLMDLKTPSIVFQFVVSYGHSLNIFSPVVFCWRSCFQMTLVSSFDYQTPSLSPFRQAPTPSAFLLLHLLSPSRIFVTSLSFPHKLPSSLQGHFPQLPLDQHLFGL